MLCCSKGFFGLQFHAKEWNRILLRMNTEKNGHVRNQRWREKIGYRSDIYHYNRIMLNAKNHSAFHWFDICWAFFITTVCFVCPFHSIFRTQDSHRFFQHHFFSILPYRLVVGFMYASHLMYVDINQIFISNSLWAIRCW